MPYLQAPRPPTDEGLFQFSPGGVVVVACPLTCHARRSRVPAVWHRRRAVARQVLSTMSMDMALLCGQFSAPGGVVVVACPLTCHARRRLRSCGVALLSGRPYYWWTSIATGEDGRVVTLPLSFLRSFMILRHIAYNFAA